MSLTVDPYSPQPGQLETYKEALERLNASIAFKSSEEDTTQAVSFEFFASFTHFTIASPGSYRRDWSHQDNPAIHKTCRRRFFWYPFWRSGIRFHPLRPLVAGTAHPDRCLPPYPPLTPNASKPPGSPCHPIHVTGCSTRPRRDAWGLV